MDRVSKEVRSRNMRRVRGKDTKPELIVRSVLHGLGYRFRLHRADLPGCPDIVLPKYRTVVLVHGCFWHQHPGCRKATIPATRSDFWAGKLGRNVERDGETKLKLKRLGWKIITIWECQTKDRETLLRHMRRRMPAVG